MGGFGARVAFQTGGTCGGAVRTWLTPPVFAYDDTMKDGLSLSADERKAWRSLYEAHGIITRRIEQDLQAAGVGSLSDYAVLYALYNAPANRVRLSELADVAMLSRSGMTRLLSRLEALGYLRREPCADDRRGIFAVLECEGVAEMRRIWAIYSQGIAAHFAAHLTDDETEAITATFRRIVGELRSRYPKRNDSAPCAASVGRSDGSRPNRAT